MITIPFETHSVMLLGLAYAFIYIVIYKRHKLLGNIGYIFLGVATMHTAATTIGDIIGFLLFFAGFMSLFIDLFKTMKKIETKPRD